MLNSGIIPIPKSLYITIVLFPCQNFMNQIILLAIKNRCSIFFFVATIVYSLFCIRSFELKSLPLEENVRESISFALSLPSGEAKNQLCASSGKQKKNELMTHHSTMQSIQFSMLKKQFVFF